MKSRKYQEGLRFTTIVLNGTRYEPHVTGDEILDTCEECDLNEFCDDENKLCYLCDNMIDPNYCFKKSGNNEEK